MRLTRRSKGLTVRAIAGTNVVQFGFNVDESRREGLLGFAVHRHREGEDVSAGEWIINRRTFAGQENGQRYWPSNEAPVQKFRWGDYTPQPSQRYEYRVSAAYGSPGQVKLGPTVTLPVTTEDPVNVVNPTDGTRHEVHFNRSGAASQAYVDRFGQKTPDEVGEAAYVWLSRGLLESMIAFIDRTRSGDALHLAMYEIHYPPFLQRLKAAADRGVDVRILYDAGTAPSAPTQKNHDALRKAGLLRRSRARAGLKNHISHHKVMLLLERGRPTAVWTGSTNMSQHAIFAQLNVGHAIYSATVAASYQSLLDELWAEDPSLKDTRIYVQHDRPSVTPVPSDTASSVFSPRSRDDAMEYYLSLMNDAEHLVIMTTPFGVDKRIEDYLEHSPPSVLKFGLVGQPGKTGGTIERIDSIDGTRYAMPARIQTSTLGRWQIEQWGEQTHAYIHTKFLLIDPLGDHPRLVTGSANFSHASCAYNDEDMLVIPDHEPATDIYVTEFLRMFEHYAFRQLVQEHHTGTRSMDLDPDDRWTARYFQPGSERERERLVFSGDHQ